MNWKKLSSKDPLDFPGLEVKADIVDGDIKSVVISSTTHSDTVLCIRPKWESLQIEVPHYTVKKVKVITGNFCGQLFSLRLDEHDCEDLFLSRFDQEIEPVVTYEEVKVYDRI